MIQARYHLSVLCVLALAHLTSGCRHPVKVYRSPALPLESGWLGMSGWRVRGVDYELSLPVQALVEAPRWAMDGPEEPPLSPGRAVGFARRAFADEFKDASAWKIDSISIETYPEAVQNATSPIRDRRYYQIALVPPEYKGPAEDHYPVWVLMDGTVVLPHPRGEPGVDLGTPPSAAPPHR